MEIKLRLDGMFASSVARLYSLESTAILKTPSLVIYLNIPLTSGR